MTSRAPSTGGEPGANNSGAQDLSFPSTRPITAGDSMQIFQINCHKSINSNLSLAFHSQDHDRFCYAVQEPYCTKSGFFLHTQGGNRNIITADPAIMPRSILVHSRHLPIIPLQQFCTRDTAVGLLTHKIKGMAAWQTKTLLIISSYWDINYPDIPQDLQEVVRYAKSQNFSFQIHMDSNCHSTLFGSKDSFGRVHGTKRAGSGQHRE